MNGSPNEGKEVDISRTKYQTSKDGLQFAGLIFKNSELAQLRSSKQHFPQTFQEWAPNQKPDKDFPDFVWIDGFITRDEAVSYAPWQRINKIPGMDFICYKSTLFIELNKMRKIFPDVYTKVYPTAFLLPNDYSEFQREQKRLIDSITSNTSNSADTSKNTPTWVVKPKNGCCGQGITLIQSAYEAADVIEQSVCQLYISPFLINQRKFDFRLYVLVANLEPLTFFIYREGIARFCTDPYEPPSRSNRDKKFCHLTNTAINKENGGVDPSEFTKKFTEIMDIILKRSPQKGQQLYTKICDATRAIILGILPMMLASLPRDKKDFRNHQTHQVSSSINTNTFGHILRVSNNKNRRISPDQRMKRKVIIPKPACNSILQNNQLHQQRAAVLEDLTPLQTNQMTKLEQQNTETCSTSNLPITSNNDTIVKSSVNQKSLLKPTKRYFHILGIDILLSEDLEPYVLELNDRPSLSVTVPFEKDLKEKFIRDSFFHVFPPNQDAPDLGLVRSDHEESDWVQIFPLPETPSPPNRKVHGFENVSFISKESWKGVLSKASIPAAHASSVASASATHRMSSSGINESLHQERRQRFNDLAESSKGIKFNLY